LFEIIYTSCFWSHFT